MLPEESRLAIWRYLKTEMEQTRLRMEKSLPASQDFQQILHILKKTYKQFLVTPEDFDNILRILNTSSDGLHMLVFALSSINGIGKCYALICCKKAGIDIDGYICFNNSIMLRKIFGGGVLTAAELGNLLMILANPRELKTPDWHLNRQEDYSDGRFRQIVSNNKLDMKLRDKADQRCTKIRNYSGVRVREQRTRTVGRR
ncbi:small ribosomal subunit protein uS13z/uS13y/uS13x-like [Silene latifolia]|uniref:small ribosomal subunit protein uS13z/uS13y/uS13x-like n=1 Tax=Silene latifolia TaxID=37657 RepID=UPI003D77B0B7